MVALSIDTAANFCAVGINDIQTGEVLSSISLDIGRGHAELLMGVIDDCMNEAKTNYGHINKIITTIGPGSFTGVRVGMSAARAIGLGLSKPVVGVSNLHACAMYSFQCGNINIGSGQIDKCNVFVILDARREEVYFQQFLNNQPIVDPMVCAIDDLIIDYSFPQSNELILCGSRAPEFARAFEALTTKTKFIIAHDRASAPIETIAAIGLATPDRQVRPEPLYIRGADAKKQTGFAVAHRNGEFAKSAQ